MRSAARASPRAPPSSPRLHHNHVSPQRTIPAERSPAPRRAVDLARAVVVRPGSGQGRPEPAAQDGHPPARAGGQGRRQERAGGQRGQGAPSRGRGKAPPGALAFLSNLISPSSSPSSPGRSLLATAQLTLVTARRNGHARRPTPRTRSTSRPSRRARCSSTPCAAASSSRTRARRRPSARRSTSLRRAPPRKRRATKGPTSSAARSSSSSS